MDWPADFRIEELSRTDDVVERILCFTHDAEAPILPGLEATGKYVEVPQLVGKGGVYFDRATVLSQVGHLDATGMPFVGIESAYKLREPDLVDSNRLMKWWTRSAGDETPAPRPRPSAADNAAMLDAHRRATLVLQDADGALATMSGEPTVIFVPTLTGGVGRGEVYRFYKHHFIPALPAGARAERVARTLGPDTIIDELLVSFMHDQEMDALLPGVPPTGKSVVTPLAVVVRMKDGLVQHVRAYWDQAAVLIQLGLLEASCQRA